MGPTIFTALPWIMIALAMFGRSEGGPWEKSWRRFKLSDGQVKTQTDVMNKAILAQLEVRKDVLSNKEELPKKFKAVDFKDKKWGYRYKPLCRLFSDVPSAMHKSRSCSCSFVRPNVIMTAGHCFWAYEEHEGGTETLIDRSPASGRVVYAVRQYGIMGDSEADHRTHTLKNAHPALEWWTAESFQGRGSTLSDEWQADVAFIKVGEPVAADEHYTLMDVIKQPIPGTKVTCEFLAASTSVMILGYPGEANLAQLAVNVKGKMSKFQKSDDGKVSVKGQIQLLGKASRNGGETIGDMNSGGSSGPWIVSESDIKEDFVEKECAMGMFAVTMSGAIKQDKVRQNRAAVVTSKLVKALDIIASLPATLAKKTPAAKATVREEVDDNIQLVDLDL